MTIEIRQVHKRFIKLTHKTIILARRAIKFLDYLDYILSLAKARDKM